MGRPQFIIVNNRNSKRLLFYATYLQMVGTTTSKLFAGELSLFVCYVRCSLAFRFVTSVVLGVSYGRRVRDLKTDEMVSYNYKAVLGRRFYPFQS